MQHRDELAFTTRQATWRDEAFLGQMLWIATHWRDPPGPGRVIPSEPSRYTDGFGRRGDHGLIATWGASPVGAAWCRLLIAPNGGYGYLADDIPELSLAVLPQYRGKGVGSELLVQLLAESMGVFDAVSLSVEPDNPAVAMYERLGFTKVGEIQGSWTMSKPLTP